MKKENIKKYTIINSEGHKFTLIVPTNKKWIKEEIYTSTVYKDKSFIALIAGIVLVTAILVFMLIIGSGTRARAFEADSTIMTTSGAIKGDDRPAQVNPWSEEAAQAIAEAEAQFVTLAQYEENTQEFVTITPYEETNSANTEKNNENWIYNATEEEVIAMARVINNEARGESYKGKVAVGATLVNRHFSDNKLYAGKNLVELATQSNQYAYSEVSIEELEKNGCIEAAKAALRGEDPTRAVFPETGALFFYNPDFCSEEALAVRTNLKEMVIGSHHFHVDFSK